MSRCEGCNGVGEYYYNDTPYVCGLCYGSGDSEKPFEAERHLQERHSYIGKSNYDGRGYNPPYPIPEDERTIADEFPGAKVILERGLARQERDEAVKRAEKAEAERDRLLEGLRNTQRDYADCREERDQAGRDLAVYRDDFESVCEQRDGWHDEFDRVEELYLDACKELAALKYLLKNGPLDDVMEPLTDITGCDI